MILDNAELVDWLRGRVFENRGRNALMYQRCADALARSATAPVVFNLEEYIASLQWSAHATDHEKTLVIGNLRNMFAKMGGA